MELADRIVFIDSIIPATIFNTSTSLAFGRQECDYYNIYLMKMISILK